MRRNPMHCNMKGWRGALSGGLIIILALCVFSAPLPAQEPQKLSQEAKDLTKLHKQLKECAGNSDRIIRTQCYDNIAEELGFLAATRNEEEGKVLATYGFWEATTRKNELGEDIYYLKIKPNNPIYTSSGAKRYPEFVIQCKTKSTDVYLDWKGSIVPRFGVPIKNLYVAYRFDADDKKAVDWEVSLDKEAIFSKTPIEFVREMNNKKIMVIEITPGNDSFKTLAFTLSGLDNGLKLLAELCYN